MIVYRVERPDGRGPYEANAMWGWSVLRHPTPIMDGISFGRLQYFYEIRYGFASIEQMRHWFDWDEVAHLSHDGFVLAHYDVRDKRHLTHGKRQIAFDRTRARRVHTESLAPLRRIA